MTKLLSFLIGICLAGAGLAQEESVSAVKPEASESAETIAPESLPEAPGLLILPAAEVTLEDFLWISRPVVVFADTPADPRFIEQMELLTSRPVDLIARDVVVIFDTDPAARTAVRLKLRPNGFQLALLAKDGKVNLRKPFPWSVREISRAIDKWPLRQQELLADRQKAAE